MSRKTTITNSTSESDNENNDSENEKESSSSSSILSAMIPLIISILLGFIWSYGPGFSNETWSNNEPTIIPATTTTTIGNSMTIIPPPVRIVHNSNKAVTTGGDEIQQQQQQQQQQDDKEVLTPSKWIAFDGGSSDYGKSTTTKLVGKLYMPTSTTSTSTTNGSDNDKVPPVPVIIMANGLGLAQDCSLNKYIEGFVLEGGFGVFTFDYSTFGYSSGLPRHDINPNTHISDIISAITTLCENAESLNIDLNNIGLWGTSFGGGHVYVIYSMFLLQQQQKQKQDLSKSKMKMKMNIPKIKAIISQVPHLASGLESVIGTVSSDPITYLPALMKTLSGIMKGIMIYYASLYKNNNKKTKTWYLPLHGPPGSTAAMQNIGDDIGYGQLCRSTSNSYYYYDHTTSSMENQQENDDNDINNNDNDNNNNDSNNNNNINNNMSSILYWRNAMTSLSAIRIMFYRPLNYMTMTKKPITTNNNNNNNNNIPSSSSSEEEESSSSSSSSTTTQTQTKTTIIPPPLLFIGAENDTLCPSKYIQRVVDNNNNNNNDSKTENLIEFVLLSNASHFDVYHNKEIFDQTIKFEINFFKKHFDF